MKMTLTISPSKERRSMLRRRGKLPSQYLLPGEGKGYMSLCTAITQDGGRCKARAIKGSEWCYNHHPDHSEERQRHASKGGKRGGRGRPAKAEHQGLREIKQLLSDLTAGVLTGEVERGTAIAANQLVNTTLRALELERR
jgi:hypothetical protein